MAGILTAMVFVPAMLAGMLVHDRRLAAAPPRAADPRPVAAVEAGRDG